ncbi:MAG: FAD-dependent oxidoreductase [Geminicoccaceae bacterium]
MYDFIVVGGGIAGLASAELLQRSGRSVLLVEAGPQLCLGASAQAQGWFHTGALYAALPSARFFRQLAGNLDDLLNYYAGFPGMNLRSGRQLVTRGDLGWFANRTNYYAYVAPSDPGVSAWMNLPWRLATLQARSRLSWFETLDFTRELSPQFGQLTLSANLRRPQAKRRFGFDLGSAPLWLASRDRTMRARLLAEELAGSFLAHGGRIELDNPVQHAGGGLVETARGSRLARNVIVSAGRATAGLSRTEVKVVQSPMLVVHPALSDVNFVKMSPDMGSTFNHLFHETEAGSYSLIGNAVYLPNGESVDAAALEEKLRRQAGAIFRTDMAGHRSALYLGDKTELVGQRQLRNYQYQIVDEGERVVLLPGKFSLCFSLAVNVCRHFGIDPAAELRHFAPVAASDLVARPMHERLFLGLREPDDSVVEPPPPIAFERGRLRRGASPASARHARPRPR